MGITIDDQRSGLFARIFGYGAFAPEKQPEPEWEASPKQVNPDNPNSYGYWKTNTSTGEKEWVEVMNLTGINKRMGDVDTMLQNFPTFNQYMKATHGIKGGLPGYGGTAPMLGLEALQGEWLQGPNAQATAEWANQFAEGLTGIANMAAEVARLRADIEEGGTLSETQQRYMQVETERYERMAQDDLYAAAAGNKSMATMLAKSEEMARGIRDMRIQMGSELRTEDAMRKMSLLQGLYQTQQLGAEQYITQKQATWTNLAQSYALQISTLVQENQDYLSEYGMELQRLNSVVDNNIKLIYAELGIETTLMDLYESSIESLYGDYYRDLEAWALTEQANANDTANMLNFLGTMAQIFGTVMMFVPGLQVPGALATAGGTAIKQPSTPISSPYGPRQYGTF